MEHIVIKKESPFFVALQSKNRSIAIYYILLFPIWSDPYPLPTVSLKQLGDSILYSWRGVSKKKLLFFFSLFLYFFYKKVNYPSNLNLIVIECLNTQRFSRVYICRLHKGLSTTSSWISRRLPNEIQDPISRHYISSRRESGSLASTIII